MTEFLRVLEPSPTEKPAALLRVVSSLREYGRQQETPEQTTFEREPAGFSVVPGSPFAYWVSEAVRGTFREFERFEGDERTVKQGLATAEDFRFVRTWWEGPAPEMDRWFGFAKGGAFSPFYADVFLRVNWAADGAQIKNNLNREGGVRSNVWMLRDTAVMYFGRPGLTWPRRTTSGFGVRAMPEGCIFADKGPAAFVDGDSPNHLLALSAILNSRAFGYLVSLRLAAADAAARSYEVGVIQQTPVPDLTDDDIVPLARMARRAWSLKRALDTTTEMSHAFLLPPGLNEQITGMDRDAVERELDSIQREIDDAAFRLYGIGPEDRAAIEAAATHPTTSDGGAEPSGDADSNEEDDVNDDAAPAAGAGNASSHGSSAWLSVVSIRASRPVSARSLPSPSPSTRCPRGRPACGPRATRASRAARHPGRRRRSQPRHLMRTSRAAASAWRVRPRRTSAPGSPREFFPLHIKMYSKSRRKAPIYWQLATPSASYSVWLYVHAFSKDTLFRVQNDYVAPEARARGAPARRADAASCATSATAAERKELAAQEAFVEELRAFLDEVKRVAPLWNPNLDDGVVINFAPLWRLVPQHKPWQKELKATWDALCAGKYDWAHLAMHLWPERVVPKCATDRSLAIAHGLEDVFWVEGADGKWTARTTPTRTVDELVARAHLARREGRAEEPARGTGRPAGRGRGVAVAAQLQPREETLMHPLHDYVAKQLADKLKSDSVVVWYDERGEFAPFVDEVRGGAARRQRARAGLGRRQQRASRRVRRLDVRAARGRRAARQRRHARARRHLPARLRARPTRVGADGAREGRDDARSRS